MSPPPPNDLAVPFDAAYGPLSPVSSTPPSFAATSRAKSSRLRQQLRFLGPGYLVAVGYMDPGNWATGLAAGSGYGYGLLWVVLMSSAMAMFLQVLAARLGLVTGMDLAQMTRRHASRRSAIVQWLLCEIAICGCDLAEVIGTAVALKMLFGLPLVCGVMLTIFDVLLILMLQKQGFRRLEAIVIALIAIVFVCFAVDLVLAHPAWGSVLRGLVPDARVTSDPQMLYLAIGIIGATVMPHNLYLHSSIVKTRRDRDDVGGTVRRSTIDVVLALGISFLINAAIVVVAAAVFHTAGHHEVVQLQDAWRLIDPLTGAVVAGFLFALALLASGQSSTLTATLAGQIVMEGFVDWKMAPWARRLLTRGIAIVPALIAAEVGGDDGVAKLLVLSQVVLSLQLPFAIWPLLRFTGRRDLMGGHVSTRTTRIVGVGVFVVIVALNAILIGRLLFA
jgi:manganese transport protein